MKLRILDTDHLSIIWGDPSRAQEILDARLNRYSSSEEMATTIISFEEQMRGWLAVINRAQTEDVIIRAYSRLHAAQESFLQIRILPYDYAAHEQFKLLRPQLRRLGTLDLRIACIALARDAVLLSRNLRDFEQVPGLKVEDWTTD